MDLLKGFKPLQDGKIHFQCPECKRRGNNFDRSYGDPCSAVVAEILCPKCADEGGAMEPETHYRKADGSYCSLDEVREAGS